MAKNKHLTLDERILIAEHLAAGDSFKAIGRILDRDCTTISKEVKSHLVFERSGLRGRPYNNCALRPECDRKYICQVCHYPRKAHRCCSCPICNRMCSRYKAAVCPSLQKAPYVCNGCKKRTLSCTLEKRLYKPQEAQAEYEILRSESRTGISLSEAEIAQLNDLISPLMFQNQSLHHICATNQDSIMVSESTLYRLVDYNLFDARNIDMPKKVRYAKRKKKKDFKVDKKCRIGRTYQDFKSFCQHNPDLPVTEIDSVEGRKGGKVLLTIHFRKAECMLAFLRDSNDSKSVIEVFNKLYQALSPNLFCNLMPILLGDNGSEFSNPTALEFDSSGNQRTHVFYCDPSAPHQKGSAERNHEFIRRFIPKGEPFDDYTQKDISLMMDHINSYVRGSLGNKCPYEMMRFLYGQDFLDSLGLHQFSPAEVTLNKSIFFKGGDVR